MNGPAINALEDVEPAQAKRGALSKRKRKARA
jgi:hypothetical protein